MVKHCLRWKPIKSKSSGGKDIYLATPEVIDTYYKGALLSEILKMPKKKALSLTEASEIYGQQQDVAFNKGRFGEHPGHYGWYSRNFVSWISSLGYHIELTGDEFEASAMPDKVS